MKNSPHLKYRTGVRAFEESGRIAILHPVRQRLDDFSIALKSLADSEAMGEQR